MMNISAWPWEPFTMGRFVVCLALSCAVLRAQGAPPQQPVFRGGAENVPVFVTVADKSGQLVPDLTRADFQVFDNGKPQPITVFDNSPQPIRIIVLVDISGSMAGNLALLRAAATALVDHFGPDDLARIGTFGERIDIGPRFTKDVAELFSALPTFIPLNAPTPLWEAVDRAIDEFDRRDASGAGLGARAGERAGGPGGANPAGSSTGGRPVVLVMSDGKDSGPQFRKRWISQLDIVDRAQREDVMLYGVGVYSRGPMGGDIRQQIVGRFPDPGLGTAAEETGGGYFELRPRDDLAARFEHIVDELHHQYLLGFTPPARDGKVHKIEVRLARKDLKPRARKTYRAPAARP